MSNSILQGTLKIASAVRTQRKMKLNDQSGRRGLPGELGPRPGKIAGFI